MTSEGHNPQMDDVQAFYDASSRQRVVRYIRGNRRLDAAIRQTLLWLPRNAARILDIGCGIGWSTWEIKRHCPDAFVLGVDLSPKAVETARLLFQSSNLKFLTRDVTQWEPHADAPFDVIVMCDIYEHIPKSLRASMHAVLHRLLTPDGTLIMSCPTPSQQEWLRDNYPHRLQPVDEAVTTEDIQTICADLDAEMVHYRPVTIWRQADYIHILIRRGAPAGIGMREELAVRLEPRDVRAERVASGLRVRVTPGSVLLPDGNGPAICVVTPHLGARLETFIRAHIERLPARVHVLHGGVFPRYRDDGRPLLLRGNPIRRSARVVRRLFFGVALEHFEHIAFRHFIKANGISAVLAEYGGVGVAVMDDCRRANVPLIVHFHGADAHARRNLEGAGKRYGELFENAAALIAVSHDMEGRLMTLGAPECKIHYNPCGADTTLFSGADPAGAAPLFIAAGRFVDKKAPHLTLLAFKEVVIAHPEARLLMMGDGPLLKACRQLCRALGFNDCVQFMGACSHFEVAGAMRHARAFVQHSVRTADGDSEGTPLSVTEAQAAGLPVVATRHAGIKDVVVEGETGLLVNEGDVQGMAEHMIRLADDPALAGELGRAGRERILAEFSLEKTIVNLWRIIEQVIDQSGKGA